MLYKVVFVWLGSNRVDPGPPPVVLCSLSVAQLYAQSVVSANYVGRCAAGFGYRLSPKLKWSTLPFKGFRAFYSDAYWTIYVVPFAW